MKSSKEKMIDWINARDREILHANSEKCLWHAWNRCLDGIEIAHEIYIINDAERRQLCRSERVRLTGQPRARVCVRA